MTVIKHINSAQPTNAVLWQMYNDLNKMPDILKHLLKPKIVNFMHNNGLRIDAIAEAIKKLQNEHFLIENNQIKLQPPILDKTGKPANPDAAPLPQMLPDKNIEDFQEKFQQLMSLTTTII